MYETLGFYEINFTRVFFDGSPELGLRAQSIVNRRTLVSGVI